MIKDVFGKLTVILIHILMTIRSANKIDKFVKQTGFTLIELMIAITISAIIVVLAAPSFNQLISRTNAHTTARAFENDLRLGRIEAKTRVAGTTNNAFVTMCPLNDNQNDCYVTAFAANDNKWVKNGWILFIDTNNDGSINGETIIKQNSNFVGKDININLSNPPPVINSNHNLIQFGLQGPLPSVSAAISPITITGSSGSNVQTISFDQTTGQTYRTGS